MKWLALAIFCSLFIFFPKKMFGVLGGVALVVGLVGSYFYYQDWAEQKESEAVDVRIEYSPEECEESSPLKVVVGNYSNRVVTKVEWNIAVVQPGFSSDLADSGFYEYFEDKILKPAETWSSCVKMPGLTKEIEDHARLVYSIKNRDVTFE